MKDANTREVVEAIADRLRDELPCPQVVTGIMRQALDDLEQAEATQKNRPSTTMRQRTTGSRGEALTDGA